ncbi:hypothetical protein AC579_1953 [Pseudocercospora musae]|uniref:Uncharacterized protein n=1 Tax=Pseudocercospora musae TaxID=113226 RepID=A0A139I7W4_9PEZI|nr:hypothetical protein AC579_1953 [Pseudocercospora musae]
MLPTQLHPLHTPPAWSEDKPLPSLPSPTLTNPDAILPNTALPSLSSPPRFSRRPPSPGYLRDTPSPNCSNASGMPATTMPKKDKLGLVSRKMMLLRTKTSSSGSINTTGRITPRATPSPSPRSIDFVPSSPILQDVGNLAPELAEPHLLQPPESERRRASGSSSSDLSAMAGFLEKYSRRDGSSDEEVLLYDSSENATPVTSEEARDSIADEADAQRRRQELEEYNSAILSKRAEQILANAKKRLNVMEGNLRGAREMVAPLTAANLKRATSLGSHSAVYGNGRILRYTYDYDDAHTQSAPRRLHTQQSSPSMANDFQNHHSRGYSEARLPNRPYTALDQHAHYVMPHKVRAPPNTHEPVYERRLRVSKSYDSLGASSGVAYGVGRERPLHNRQSPDQIHLEPLTEDDEMRSNRNSGPLENNGLGFYRPSSRTSDLRDQMSSLKGKISSLKEKAREDSLRRQSHTNLRVSPFNDALQTAPEFFYATTNGYGEPPVDANARFGWTPEASPVSSAPREMWKDGLPVTGSRNAFAEQAAPPKQEIHQARIVDIRIPKTPNSKFQIRQSAQAQLPHHRRTASGRVVVDSAKNRYSHHQHNNSQSSQSSQRTIEMPTAFLKQDTLEDPSPDLSSDQYDSSPPSSGATSPQIDTDYEPCEDATSVYTDAPDEQPVTGVAHEDREDAFDYEHFFLLSAMGSYSGRRGSESSEATASSTATARGPALVEDEDDDTFSQFSAHFPPPPPETPEKLREIQRNMHRRSTSDESITTTNTYATAEEDPVSPIDEGETYRQNYLSRSHVISPVSRQHSRQDSYATQSTASTTRPVTSHKKTNSRPSTSSRRPSLPRTDSSSDRADSGVGISGRSASANDIKRMSPRSAAQKHSHSGKLSNGSAALSSPTPPMSPRKPATKIDPVTVAVQALLDPHGHPLGLRNKAVLFGVVESLRKVVRQLQEEEESTFAARMLRNQLDEAKRTLDGL